MKKIITGIFTSLVILASTHASFIYQEIDPICSISGTTHTSFPVEISDTSSWYIPKAYDGECEETKTLKASEKDIIETRVVAMFSQRGFIAENTSQWYTLTSQGKKFAQDKFFPAVVEYISTEMKKSKPNTKAIAVLNYAVKQVGYDYFIAK